MRFPSTIYANPLIPHGYYWAKVTDLRVEHCGMDRPRLWVELEIGPMHEEQRRLRLCSIIHPTPASVYFHISFIHAFRISGMMELRQDALDDRPVFLSRHKRHLHPSQVLRIVRAAAKRAGIEKAVSPHWFRHAHASHALDRGAPISLVQSTLGHSQISTTGRYLHARPNDSSGRYLPL